MGIAATVTELRQLYPSSGKISCEAKVGVTLLACGFIPSLPDIVPVTPRTVMPSRMLEGISFASSAASIYALPLPSW